MKKVYWAIVILLIAAVAGFAFIARRNLADSFAGSVEVAINDSGFSPEKIIIFPGTTVTWTNDGKNLHWPASNFHPTHTLYPDPGGCIGSKLDACKGLNPRESFSFTFSKAGEWPIHDHLFPGLVMVVEVSQKKLTKIQNDARLENNLNYGEELNNIKTLAAENPASAWAHLKEKFIVNGHVVGNAHEFAHIVGNYAYKKFGLEGVEICDNSFAYGCFHGVTEEMLLKKGAGSLRLIQDQCLKIYPPGKSQNYTGCIHGSWHGLFTWEGGNLKKALADCDALDELYRPFCYDGVFMENSSIGKNKVFDENDPWKLCAILDARYHRNCARYQSQIFLGSAGIAGVTSAGKYCSKGPSESLSQTCYESIGYFVAQSSLGKPKNIADICQKMPSQTGMELCLLGAGEETVFQKYPDWNSASRDICSKIKSPVKSDCLNAIENVSKI